jgi:hypothetical protein
MLRVAGPWASIADQVGPRRGVDPLVPQLGEVGQHWPSSASGPRVLAVILSVPGTEVATSDQQVSLRRSSNGKSNSVASISVVSSIDTLLDPVEGLVARQAVQHALGALADQCLHPPGWPAPRWADRLALFVVLGRVHRDEHRQRSSIGPSNSVMPPLVQSDENTAGWVSTA